MEDAHSKHRKKGRLKIFLGMAAGVGKTYTMLEAARKKMEEGVNVVVAIAETHGRPETANLLKPLTIVPLKEIIYKGKVFNEPDIEAIIKLNPDLVIMDELAHSNVPGSKHLKRWQDVVELLEAGIDVFTTLNIQHVESYKDIVEGITEVKIRETVPDYVLEQAEDIELVDIPPADLVKRLKEGKVYTGDLSEVALLHFFQEDRLTALREIALRFTAEMVDLELLELRNQIQRDKPWKQKEQLLLACNHYPTMQQLIRAGRRLAVMLHAPWTVVYIDEGKILSDEETASLSKNLALARELGAKVVTTQDASVVLGIRRIAAQQNATQIILGKSQRSPFLQFFTTSIAEKLTNISNADIHIIPVNPLGGKKKLKKVTQKTIKPYFTIILWAAFFLVSSWILAPYVGYQVVLTVLILSILVFSLFYTHGPLFLGALIYTLVWDFIFVTEPFVARLNNPRDIFLVNILFFLAALITGILSSRVKRREDLLLKKERYTQGIYDIVQEITTAQTPSDLYKAVEKKLGFILRGKCKIIPVNLEGRLDYSLDTAIGQDIKEQAVAQWVFEHDKEAGWSTSTLPSVENLFVPLKAYTDVVGVIAYCPEKNRPLLPDEKNFLYTVAQQVAYFMERSLSKEREVKEAFMHQANQIYGKVLQSIADALYKPLKAIQDTVIGCEGEQIVVSNPGLLSHVKRIKHTSANLLHIAESAKAMAKLSGDDVKFEKSLNNIASWIEATCKEMENTLKDHQIVVSVNQDLPLIAFDRPLMTILLRNVLTNAAEYSPQNTIIEIEATQLDGNLILSVLDEGKGIPEELVELIFEKFYRVEGTETPGLGLGLAIVKAVADIHHAIIKVRNRPIVGTKFTLILPIGVH